ncbi:MAG: hypothetical protein IJ565_02400 [Bacilli bacterium]|nr:hypothetical protein [Bacilli bacterium]
MKAELQMDIIQIVGSILLAIVSKVLELIIGESTLFAIINLIALILFVKGIITFIEHKYDVKILKFTNTKTISER